MLVLRRTGTVIFLQVSTYFIQFVIYPFAKSYIYIDPDFDNVFLVISSIIITVLWLRYKDIRTGYLLISLPLYPILANVYQPSCCYGLNPGGGSFGLSWGLEYLVTWFAVLCIQIVMFVFMRIMRYVQKRKQNNPNDAK